MPLCVALLGFAKICAAFFPAVSRAGHAVSSFDSSRFHLRAHLIRAVPAFFYPLGSVTACGGNLRPVAFQIEALRAEARCRAMAPTAMGPPSRGREREDSDRRPASAWPCRSHAPTYNYRFARGQHPIPGTKPRQSQWSSIPCNGELYHYRCELRERLTRISPLALRRAHAIGH